MKLLGVDTGGTFTDFVYFDGKTLKVYKTLSTPEAPEKAVLQGIEALAVKLDELDIIHGTTVVTNAVLEHKGVKTAYITNRGFADLLTIGRQARRELYNLQPQPVPPPVEPSFCLETGGRLAADGRVMEPLSVRDLLLLRQQIETLAPTAVAINLLFSYLDDRFERQIAEALPESIFISCSAQVLAEIGEYERGIVTWLNAWIGPLAANYLTTLEKNITPARLTVMQSNGGTVSVQQAAKQAVGLLLSGPAGGLKGAQHMAARSGRTQLLTLDMGGTSTDVALIDGEISLTTEGKIGHYPVAIPMVDMHTIGAGGGSIVSVDAGGLLQVGPQSAGAFPGPACYGRGAEIATVTDANLVAGRILAHAFLGGRMQLDSKAAYQALEKLALKLKVSVIETAHGIIRIANEHMIGALREISVQRGVDPRGYTLVSFGGAGGLHVCALAQALEIKKILIPKYAGVLSALGMLVSPRSRQLSRTVNVASGDIKLPMMESMFNQLIQTGIDAMVVDGTARELISIQRNADLRYLGQSYSLTLPWQQVDSLVQAFHQAHLRRYGHQLDEQVELATLRVSLRAQCKPLDLGNHLTGHNNVFVEDNKNKSLPAYGREAIKPNQIINGPALIIEEVATTYIASNWRGTCDDSGNLLLQSEH